MNRKFFGARLLTGAFLAASLLVGCGEKENPRAVEDYSDRTGAASDEATVRNETDDIINQLVDSMSMVNGYGGGRLGGSSSALGCGVTVTKAPGTGPRKVTYTFSSDSVCNGRVRSGSVSFVLSRGSKWSDVNAKMDVFFENLSISRRVGTNRTIYVLNGYHTLTNLRGGLIRTMGLEDTITHKVRGAVRVSFSNGQTRTWNVFRRRRFLREPNQYRLTVYGDSSGYRVPESARVVSNVSATGLDRFGNPFVSLIEQPIEINSTCGWRSPRSGVKNHIFWDRNREVRVIYGVNSIGIAQTQGCPEYYKVEFFTINGRVSSSIFGY